MLFNESMSLSSQVARLDPVNCECADCVLAEGPSKPLNQASDHEMVACAIGVIENATGLELRALVVVEASFDSQRWERISLGR